MGSRILHTEMLEQTPCSNPDRILPVRFLLLLFLFGGKRTGWTAASPSIAPKERRKLLSYKYKGDSARIRIAARERAERKS